MQILLLYAMKKWSTLLPKENRCTQDAHTFFRLSMFSVQTSFQLQISYDSIARKIIYGFLHLSK